MTSIHFDPALFESPAEREPAEQLIVNGRYYLPPLGDPTGKRRSLQRVTNFIKQLSDTAGLEKWKLRSTVTGLAIREDFYDLACSIDPNTARGKQELDELVERCIDASKAHQGSGGNETGTALHNLTDNVGHQPTRVRPKWAPKVENYRAALHAKGLRAVPGLSERLVVSERYGTCGRLDDVYEDPFGTLRVGDRKSQKEFYTWWEIGAQLALYQGSDAMWNEQTASWEDMPKLADDFAHVAWMPLSHPDAKKGGDVDAVTIYDIDLEGPREVLEWCLKVRTLRTQARRWGAERVDLDEFARIARDIRDAESQDDLRKMINAFPALSIEGDPLHIMAVRRWEALQPAPNEVLSPNTIARQATIPREMTEITQPQIEDVLRRQLEDAQMAETSSTWAAVHVAPHVLTEVPAQAPPSSAHAASRSENGDFECRFDGKRVSEHPINIPGHYHCISPQPRWIEPAPVVAAPHVLTEVAPGVAVVHEHPGNLVFDPALFVAPAQDATFPDGEPGCAAHGHPEPGCEGSEVPGAGGTDLAGPSLIDFTCRYEGKPASAHPINIPGYFHCVSPEPRPAPMSAQAREELHTPDVWAAEWGMRIVSPDGWSAQSTLGALDFATPIGRDEFGARMRQSRCQQIALLHEAAKQLTHPVATAKFTYSKHENATVIELPVPDDEEVRLQEIERRQSSPIVPTSTDDRETAIEALDSVPIKIVREVCARANNSKSSRGRVRLLNDVEDKKYAAHGVELLPALLREWLIIDGLNGEPGFNKDGVPRVANTGGSSREPMDARQAGRISLSEYLATKEAPKSVVVTEEAETAPSEVRGDDAVIPEGESSWLTQMREREEFLQANDDAPLADGTLAGDRERIMPGATHQVRQKYLSVSEGPNAGKHSIARLIELAKEARDGAERAQVFHEFARRKAMTGAIAAEINQHYLDNGYATEDFDPYFEAQQIDSSPVPPDPDDPDSAEDAIMILESIASRDQLARAWTAFSAQPWFSDQRLQEALMSKMASVK